MKINITFQDKTRQLSINRIHYIRRLGYPKNYEVPEPIEKSMQWAAKWYREKGDPWLHVCQVEVDLRNEKLYLHKKEIKAPKIFKRFQKHHVKKALLIASTAGIKVDEKTTAMWLSEYPDRAFFLGTFAASVAEAIVSFAIEYIRQWTAQKGMKALSRYSPGFPGWDLKEQFLLMEILQQESKGQIPITISDTALLTPVKSQLSLVGIYTGTQHKEQIDTECLQCNFMDCTCKDKGMFVKK